MFRKRFVISGVNTETEGRQPRMTLRRRLALVLCVCMLAPYLTGASPAPAAEAPCPHHREHTAECGYVEAVEGAPCTHVHDQSCGYAEGSKASPCTHVHDDSCTRPVTNCVHVHTEDCYTPTEVPGAAGSEPASTLFCTHVCTVESGCVTPGECTHVHDDSCGYSEGSGASPCTHVHDQSCGYVEAVEGAPCTYVCEICTHTVSGWSWTEGGGNLAWDDGGGVWTLYLPGASRDNPVTAEEVRPLLPGEIKAELESGDSETLSLSWDLSALPECACITETLKCGHIHDEHCGITWYEGKASCRHRHDDDCYKSSRVCAHVHGDECYSGGDRTGELICTHVCSGGVYKGSFNLSAALPEGYTLKGGVPELKVRAELGTASQYREIKDESIYPGRRRIFHNEDELTEALQKHALKGLSPSNVTVNLFDYIVEPEKEGKTDVSGNDILDKANVAGNNVATYAQWNKGINKGACLTFGDSVVEAGCWNLEAGALRPWGMRNTNMKGIVERVLVNGYPKIDMTNAQKPINDLQIVGSDDWSKPAGEPGARADISYVFWAEKAYPGNKGSAEAVKTVRGLSEYTLNGEPAKQSLAYLFDPDTGDDGKRSYTNVTGLFQLDREGFYYYDGRKNSAELNKNTKQITLYDGPAIWGDDSGWDENKQEFTGTKSLGGFFPFNSAAEVFDCIDTDKNILSSSPYLSSEWQDYHTKGDYLINQATGKTVNLNHYVGMTMELNFIQPVNGQVKNGGAESQDMVFEFAGADDAWVFVDDVLVLDIGGIHSEMYGYINFATGEVEVGQAWRDGGDVAAARNNPKAVKDKGNLYQMFVDAGMKDSVEWTDAENANKTFDGNTEHTLKLFYLNRSNYGCPLYTRFNMQPLLYQQLKKVDQNGNALPGVEFELYAAKTRMNGSADAGDYEIINEADGPLTRLTTDSEGRARFEEPLSGGSDASECLPFDFADRYDTSGTEYYILKEAKTPEGYRALPINIVLKYDNDTNLLVVENRYQTGAYASFTETIQGNPSVTYGTFDPDTGKIVPSAETLPEESQHLGLIVAVPMMFQENMGTGQWMALYGSNTSGFKTVRPDKDAGMGSWRDAALQAALCQMLDSETTNWYLYWDNDSGRLVGSLTNLPGRADSYLLHNPDGDMQMLYGVIQPWALKKLGVTGTSAKERYESFLKQIRTRVLGDPNGVPTGSADELETIRKLCMEILGCCADSGSGEFVQRGFSFLNTSQFNRSYCSLIYVPSKQRELRVKSVDQDGNSINGAEFTLYKASVEDDGRITAGKAIGRGVTANVEGQDGTLILTSTVPENTPGYLKVLWESNIDSADAPYFILKETKSPPGHTSNPTEIPVVLGTYAVYADAGGKDDGVVIMAGVGKLTQTMKKYAADDTVNITLRDIISIAQTQQSIQDGAWSADGWKDDKPAGSQPARSMNLHYDRNAVVDYGIHDSDGGKSAEPVFVTDVGFIRARAEQNTDALEGRSYTVEKPDNSAKWDNLRGVDISNLYTGLNIVVVTDRTETDTHTGKLSISRSVTGSGLTETDYRHRSRLRVSLKAGDGTSLPGSYHYYGANLSGEISDGGSIYLSHDETVEVMGLPAGTRWTVEALPDEGWQVSPVDRLDGEIDEGRTDTAAFVYGRTSPKVGSLRISAAVTGDDGDTEADFCFKVLLMDAAGNALPGQYRYVGDDYGKIASGGSVTLRRNESILITGLPGGTRYSVTENGGGGYTVDKTGDSGVIRIDTTSIVAFTKRAGADLPDKNGSAPQKAGKP